MTSRERAAFAVFSTWITIGLFVDGWAHNHDKPETFFTPWHGLLYTGFMAAVLWGIREGRLERQSGRPSHGPAVGGGLALIGLILFGVGGVADMIWHQIFGIEQDTAALLSPTHLLLMTGGLLAATGPLRSARAFRDGHDDRSFATFFPVALSMTVAIAVVAFFLQFASPFLFDRLPAGDEYGVLSVLVTNALFMGGAIYLLRWWTPPAGTFTFMCSVVVLAILGLHGFEQLPLLAAGFAGGAAADLLARRRWWFATVVPLVLWGTWLAVFAAVWGVGWEAEFWTGTLFLAALTGAGLAALGVTSDA
jgi:hypothetical protein